MSGCQRVKNKPHGDTAICSVTPAFINLALMLGKQFSISLFSILNFGRSGVLPDAARVQVGPCLLLCSGYRLVFSGLFLEYCITGCNLKESREVFSVYPIC